MLKLLRGTSLLLLLVCGMPAFGQEPKIEIRITGIPNEPAKPEATPQPKADPQAASPVIFDAKLKAKLDANYGSETLEKTAKTIVAGRLSLSQTFTVATTGTLVRVEVPIGYTGAPPVKPLIIDIRRVKDGVPVETNDGADVLTRMSVREEEMATQTSWQAFDLPPCKVKAGEQYALVLSTESRPEFHWAGDTNWELFGHKAGTYAGGQGRTRGTSAARAPDDKTPRERWGNHYLVNSGKVGGGPDVDFLFRVWVRPAAGAP